MAARPGTPRGTWPPRDQSAAPPSARPLLVVMAGLPTARPPPHQPHTITTLDSRLWRIFYADYGAVLRIFIRSLVLTLQAKQAASWQLAWGWLAAILATGLVSDWGYVL